MLQQLLIMVAVYIISYALAGKPPKPKPAALSDFKFPVAEEGTPQYVIFGDVWVEDWIVLGLDNFRVRAIKTSGGLK